MVAVDVEVDVESVAAPLEPVAALEAEPEAKPEEVELLDDVDPVGLEVEPALVSGTLDVGAPMLESVLALAALVSTSKSGFGFVQVAKPRQSRTCRAFGW